MSGFLSSKTQKISQILESVAVDPTLFNTTIAAELAQIYSQVLPVPTSKSRVRENLHHTLSIFDASLEEAGLPAFFDSWSDEHLSKFLDSAADVLWPLERARATE